MTSSTDAAVLDPELLRPDFPILQREIRPGIPLVYLDNAATTQRPKQVVERIAETYYQSYANVSRGAHKLAAEADALYLDAREKVRALLGAASLEEIIFTRGTTEGINLVARSWGDAHLRPGDEILLTEMEHHSNLVPWYQAAERTGASVRHLPVTDDGRLALDQLDAMLGERTRLVSVTAVSNVLGTINPLETIIAKARAAGALVLVDAAQGIPHMPIDVARLDCDFLAFSGHKMCGPSGIGVLYGKRALFEEMPPFQGGGSMIARVGLDGFEPTAPPAKFEAGTPAIVPAIGLAAAIDYVQRIGLEAIHRHEQRLTARAHEVLDALGGIRRLGPADVEQKGGIVSFTAEGCAALDLSDICDRSAGVALRASHHCAEPLHARYGIRRSVRASFYFYNTLEEIDRLGEALQKAKQMLGRRKRR
jgi:cysteine desulfurase/selenocysteine lyase